MKRLLKQIWFAFTLATLSTQTSAQVAPARPASDAVVVLITEQEAALAPKRKAPVALANRDQVDDRAITRSPKVMLTSPNNVAVDSPIHFEVRFQTFNGAQIDPKRVKLTYIKQSPIDLTPRIFPFIKEYGIDIPRAQVASGDHQIQIDVTDTEDRRGSALIELNVER